MATSDLLSLRNVYNKLATKHNGNECITHLTATIYKRIIIIFLRSLHVEFNKNTSENSTYSTFQ